MELGLFSLNLFQLISWLLGLSFEEWSYLAQVVTAASVIFAALSFYEQRNTQKRASTARQIEFYRTVVIKAGDEMNVFIDKVKAKKPNLILESTELVDDISIKWLLSNLPRQTLIQQFFWSAAQSLYPEEYKTFIPGIFNPLEQLSVDILSHEVSGRWELISIRKGFITYVEAFMWPMLLNGPYSPDIYPAIKTLYYEWRDKVDRTPIEVNKKRIENDIKAVAETLRKTMSTDEYKKLKEALSEEGRSE